MSELSPNASDIRDFLIDREATFHDVLTNAEGETIVTHPDGLFLLDPEDDSSILTVSDQGTVGLK
jgi:hypothetical protein